MAEHNDHGAEGEELATHFLIEKGYKIIERNWRSGKQEIDIIALKDNVLHFIEVKALVKPSDNNPEERVNYKKFRHLAKAAEAYTEDHPASYEIQYDVVSVILSKPPVIDFFEDLFYYF